MNPETLELALHGWTQWRRSIDMAREWLSYDPRSPESERIEWWESNKSGALQDVCRRMLTRIHRRTPMDGVRTAEGGG